MDTEVRDYLIGAHSKVIAHYRKVLQSTSLAPPERERIQKRLEVAETELAAILGDPLAKAA